MRRQLGGVAVMDELISYGHEALLGAARTFDADRGVPFRRWAALRIRGAMIDAVRAQSNIPRRVYQQLRALQAADQVHEASVEDGAAGPVTDPNAADKKLSADLGSAAMAMAMAFLTIQGTSAIELAHDPKETPEDEAARAELLGRIRAAIAERPEAERRLLERHYFDDVQLETAARELGLSKSWGSRLHARAIEAVQRTLKRDRIG
jgi:RNA polymerase sigma factor for flagellar operon FliA